MFFHEGFRDGLKSFSKIMADYFASVLIPIIIQPDSGQNKQMTIWTK